MSRVRIVHVQEAEQPPRASSVAEVTSSRFLVRTSNFLKKVSNIRGTRKKTSSDVNESSTQDAASFAARSIGLGRKSFGYSQPILGAHNAMPARRTTSEHEDCSEGGSTPSPRSSNAAYRSSLTRTTANPATSTNCDVNTNTNASPNVYTNSPPATMSFHPVVDGLPPSFDEPSRLLKTPPGDPPPPVRATSPSLKVETLPVSNGEALASPPSRSSSLPHLSNGSQQPATYSPGTAPQMRFARTPDLSREQSLHLRLASLPPPMMARYTTQGSARLTPSHVPRQPPMPILNLPTLPPPTPVLSPPAPHRAPLRSMPALPHTGPRDDENPDMDEEGSDSDNDGMDDDDAEVRDDNSDDDDDGEDSPLPQAPIMSRRRNPLPLVDTSPFNLAFSFSSRSPAQASGSGTRQQNGNAGMVTPSADISRTPQPHRFDAPMDYFSSKNLQPDDGIEEVIRTPRPTDYTPEVPIAGPSRSAAPVIASSAHGPGMIPKIVPMPSIPSHRSPRSAVNPAAPELTSRPSLYHHGSRSMIDLVSHTMEKEEKVEKRSSRVIRPSTGNGPSPHGPLDVPPPPTPTLRRQRSLPTYRPASLPPPYPQFFPAGHSAIIQPREEEGQEELPCYTNSVYMCTMMPRKLEFTAPGVQAKERKWRRVMVELDGTVLRVYRCHGAGNTGKGGKVGEWWERTVGVGDWSTGDIATASAGRARVNGASGQRERRQPSVSGNAEEPVVERRGKGEEEEGQSEVPQATPTRRPPHQALASKSKLSLVASSLLHPTRSSQDSASSSRLTVPSPSPTRSRLSFDTSREVERIPPALGAGRRSIDALQRRRSITRSVNSDAGPSPTSPASRSSNLFSSSTSPLSATSGRSRSRGPSTSHSSTISSATTDSSQTSTTLVPDSKDLIKCYTLQHAESGLASDYMKRRNVIRVRMEGEQFLLQARDVPGVIDWIESIQAATSIALDLDERPMPKGPMFPRRRRRRARRPDGSTAATTNINVAPRVVGSLRTGDTSRS